MEILVVCSGTKGILSPFIRDQIQALKNQGVEIDLFQINKPGVKGYLEHLILLKKRIKIKNPDIVHAHYGLSGLLANLQRKIPVVTTFHGSDVNTKYLLKYSRLAYLLSTVSIFVSEDLRDKLNAKKHTYVIPCGVDLNVFAENKSAKLDVIQENCYNILFSSSFSNGVKNYPLAQKACLLAEKQLNKKINLIELKGFTRNKVASVMSQADCLLLTSFSEGSPQFIKEAMACNRPIVATNVGDIEWLFDNEPGHFLTSFDPKDVAEKIKMALDFKEKHGRTNGRQRIIELGLDSDSIAKKIIKVYEEVV